MFTSKEKTPIIFGIPTRDVGNFHIPSGDFMGFKVISWDFGVIHWTLNGITDYFTLKLMFPLGSFIKTELLSAG